MEASGLARMLLDQKDLIAAAMPAGLASMLGVAGKRKSGGPSSSPEARIYDGPQAAHTQYRAAGADVQRAVSEAKSGPTSSWAYWALPLLALAGLLWYLLPSGHTPDTTAQTKSASAPAPVRLLPRADDKSIYLTRVPAGWSSIGTYHNQEIYNRSGESIGVVKDLLVGPDGKINAAVIGVGRFLGMGEKDVAVPLALLQAERRDSSGNLIMDVARDVLRTAPAFEPSGTGSGR
jgi:hypothetical protein